MLVAGSGPEQCTNDANQMLRVLTLARGCSLYGGPRNHNNVTVTSYKTYLSPGDYCDSRMSCPDQPDQTACRSATTFCGDCRYGYGRPGLDPLGYDYCCSETDKKKCTLEQRRSAAKCKGTFSGASTQQGRNTICNIAWNAGDWGNTYQGTTTLALAPP